MKKVCIYFLLLIFAGDNTEMHQLLKLPLLFRHLAEHQQRDSRVSVIDFLSMHYWGQDIDDHDDAQDMSLPFKKIDAHPAHALFLPSVPVIQIKAVAYAIQIQHTSYLPFHAPEPACTSPFRPPCV